jgi:hypothetical protein
MIWTLVSDHYPYFNIDLMYPWMSVHRIFEVRHSAPWHEFYTGETRITLDLSGLVPSDDTTLARSLVPRNVGLERWDHRVIGISLEDIECVKDRLADTLVRPLVTSSGVDWRLLCQNMMQYLLNIKLDMLQFLLITHDKFRDSCALCLCRTLCFQLCHPISF